MCFGTQGVYKPNADLLNETFMAQPKQIVIFGIDKPAGNNPFTTVIRSGRHPINVAGARVPRLEPKKNVFSITEWIFI